MAIFTHKQKDELELGFGSKNYKNPVRFLNKDGSVNVRRTGLGWINNTDIYHSLISASLLKLILLIISSYILINIFFAFVYYSIGASHFGGLEAETGSEFQKFMGLFFFSAQTITTLGYGHIYPIGNAASIAAAVESLLGLLSFALATGVLYGRFSRPKAHVLYSENILISPYKDGKGLMFRITNKKQYELIESEASVTMTITNPESNKREFLNLKLEIRHVNFMALSWTIVHHITEESPLYGLTQQQLAERDVEFIILIKAINDTYSQGVNSRHSYKAHELVENAKFKPLSPESTKRGTLKISVTDIHLYESLN
ncbi:ion channel [Aurantibacillus circumpalustris]|uniref:ion channel n=1 Tax=Aurantibacillus circumpalustris TaxID=3036359 RepID=UPI00295AE2EE|nr:ion channel [Aurantibacillus circumpalustris]